MYSAETGDTPAQDDVPCAYCGNLRSRHGQLEAVGAVHHRWANDRLGGMTVVESNTPGNRAVDGSPMSGPIIIAPAPDIRLRQFLRDKGVITPEEYDALG